MKTALSLLLCAALAAPALPAQPAPPAGDAPSGAELAALNQALKKAAVAADPSLQPFFDSHPTYQPLGPRRGGRGVPAGGQPPAEPPGPPPSPPPTVSAAMLAPKPAVKIPQGFIVGSDISWVQATEEGRGGRRGGGPVKFKENGVEKDILEILKAHGFNYIRLRIFVDPTQPTPRDNPYSAQGYCDLPHTIAMGKRIKDAGMGFLLDFHYSDSWADPGKQYIPLAWSQLSFDDLVKKVHDYTEDVIKQLAAAGAKPDMVQIGNEITPGMMIYRSNGVRGTPNNQLGPAESSTANWDKLAALLKAGLAGARAADPNIITMLHIAVDPAPGDPRGWQNYAAIKRWVDNALARGVQFDVLGLSAYTNWHGPPEGWKANFERLVTEYPNLSFCIAEISVEVASTHKIMHDLPGNKGLGVFLWEATGNNLGQTLFDNQGNLLPEKIAPYDQVKKDYAARIVTVPLGTVGARGAPAPTPPAAGAPQ